jgi:hypothetical protein
MSDIKDQIIDSTKKVIHSKEFLPTAGGGIAGWVVGSSIGIVAMGGGIAGSLVLAPVCGVIGWAYAKGYRITRKSDAPEKDDHQ